ncbi:hypothetical protein EYF80_015372 [Liparis tanakae]|uniref:Uncharacterized protein n=1 Tax=Liparis tanakae TaxID=230148 RepID=A0A4Z2IBD6_9TELE|nr:hypothetical protein EYF80_015372 [Liparis tanakae]
MERPGVPPVSSSLCRSPTASRRAVTLFHGGERQLHKCILVRFYSGLMSTAVFYRGHMEDLTNKMLKSKVQL